MAEESKKESKKEKVKRVLRRGYGWKVATIALLALLIISIFSGGFKDLFFGQQDVGSKEAADKAVEYINTKILQGSDKATLKDVSDSEVSSLYKINLVIGGVTFPSYVTKDGKYLIPQELIAMQEKEATEETNTDTTGTKEANCANTPKKEKPEIQLFVMSHCPYGTQMEKGIIPVLNLLKDKVDFKLNFVYYAMHGEKEVTEETRQYCIQKEQESKLIPYLGCFLKDGNSEPCLTEAGIDTKKLDSCVKATDEEFKITENLNDQTKWLNGRYPLFNANKALNEKYGVGGSPTLVINDESISSSRDPASLLSTVCCAFEEQPAECKEALSTTTPSAGFGVSTSTTASSGSCG